MEAILTARPQLWTYDELADRLEAEGVEIRDEDGKIKSSLRTAVWTLVQQEGVARRGPEGTVYATLHHDALVDADDLNRLDIFGTFTQDDVEAEVR